MKRNLAVARNGSVVLEQFRICAEAAAGEGFEHRASVCTVVAVLVGLNPGVSRGYTDEAEE